MKKTFFQNLFMLTATVIMLAFSGCSKSFEIKSSAFKNDERIPDQYYYVNPNTPERLNISLPLSWANPPAETKSFALLVHHSHRAHWAVFNIPVDCRSFAEGASGKNMPGGSVELINYFRTPGYGGMEPPGDGRQTHVYNAIIYALNTDEITINDPDVYKTVFDIENILAGKIIAQTEITGYAQIE